MLGPLALLCALLFPGGVAAISVEQPAVVVARAGSWATLPCKASTSVSYIHWYCHQEGTAPKRILMLDMSSSYVTRDGVLTADKVHAKKGKDSTSSNLLLLKLAKSDEGVYYCAVWEKPHHRIMVFAEGTKVIVTPPDRSLDADTSPKPTLFLPSMAEIKFDRTGTYLCLLENFFPDVVKIDWKEKNSKRILISQQGNTMKTKDTYMKYTWLTRTKKSINKEHKCIFTHETNKGGVDHEIAFHSMKKELAVIDSIEASLKDENDPLWLQLANTSAYYTYVILLVKSMVYTIIITYCLLGRPALCRNEKSCNTWWPKAPLFFTGYCR